MRSAVRSTFVVVAAFAATVTATPLAQGEAGAPSAGVPRGFGPYAAEDSGGKRPADGPCGVTVDRPHFSHQAWERNRSHEIHTRVHSRCNVPYQLISISATTYRGHWYGWEEVGGKSPSLPKRNNDFIVAVARCEPNSTYQYRTEGTGVANVNGKTVSASAYEQNDEPIKCAP